jgi:histidinol-phosphate/aromatic aminotransferase/cobyric acid decarboxylase-like protein
MTQPTALRLAEWLDLGIDPYDKASAAELRRLHEVNQELIEALEEVVRVIESNPPAISDTIWVTNGSPETLYDHCQAALAKAKGEE